MLNTQLIISVEFDLRTHQLHSCILASICAMPPAVSCEISPVALKIVLMYRIMYDVIIIIIIIIIVISLTPVSLHRQLLQECRHIFSMRAWVGQFSYYYDNVGAKFYTRYSSCHNPS